MKTDGLKPSYRRLTLAVFALGWSLTACAETRVTIVPPNPAPVCDKAAMAQIIWGFQWRPDQKDVALREQAAETGIRNFFEQSGCFAGFQLQRNANHALADKKRIHLTIRELGPVLRLFVSPALIDGGTEVVLDVAEYAPAEVAPGRSFTVHWQHGGPGYITGVASLPQDLQAALAAALKPARAPGFNPTP